VETLFLAMALYPEVQKKAQAEIDVVVGPNRFPDFHDRPSLPYINAIVKELTRWNLVAPLGGPFAVIHHCYHPDEFRRFSPHVYYR
jgi:cytochrome P450